MFAIGDLIKSRWTTAVWTGSRGTLSVIPGGALALIISRNYSKTSDSVTYGVLTHLGFLHCFGSNFESLDGVTFAHVW